ncbi:DNA primase [Rickettsiella endosymbiont of Dermanyssus gallinae]|uniref:DNA primase n=1 Tax=Rickettsiella endosymbiont of Dermanyssus gallinae TaxID=2856608 RepID=UPI001C52B76A|nr:DNA primase [Rickettsiella endosymbiont of Dermanyssus gallinae]
MSSTPIPQDFINDLLARCDIVQLIDERVPLRKKGKSYTACCPFHTEKTPSFTVAAEKQFYYCFGCSAGGNALSFLMDYERLSFPEAVELLAEQFGLQVPHSESYQSAQKGIATTLYPLLEKVAAFYAEQLRATPAAIEYLKQRGLSGQLAKKFSLGYAPAAWDHLLKAFKDTDALLAAGLLIKKSEGKGFYDRFRDRIIFPIRDKRGRVIGFGGRILTQGQSEAKYLNSPETILFHKGKELYGLHEVCHESRQSEYIIVVEGYMDVLALFQAQIPCAVATLGTATSSDQILRLFSIKQEIIFCFDGDEAGRKAAWRVLEIGLALLQDGYSMRFLLLPDGEDPDSFVRKQGREAFMALVRQAHYLGDFLFEHLLTQLDISQLEGKARLAKLAIPLIEKIPLGIMQHKLFEQLAALINMDVRTLKQVTQSEINTPVKPRIKKTDSAKRFSPMRLAIAFLVQYPQLAKTLSEQQCQLLKTLDLPGSSLLIKLFLLLKESPELSSAMLLEYWRDDEASYKILQQLIHYSVTIPTTGIQAEFHDLLNHLQNMAVQQSIDKLLHQAKQSVLTEEQKRHLYQLILSTRGEK